MEFRAYQAIPPHANFPAPYCGSIRAHGVRQKEIELQSDSIGTDRLSCSAFEKLFDAALKLPLLLLAAAKPFAEVGIRQFGWLLFAEGHADEVVAPPDDPGEE